MHFLRSELLGNLCAQFLFPNRAQLLSGFGFTVNCEILDLSRETPFYIIFC